MYYNDFFNTRIKSIFIKIKGNKYTYYEYFLKW